MCKTKQAKMLIILKVEINQTSVKIKGGGERE